MYSMTFLLQCYRILYNISPIFNLRHILFTSTLKYLIGIALSNQYLYWKFTKDTSSLLSLYIENLQSLVCRCNTSVLVSSIFAGIKTKIDFFILDTFNSIVTINVNTNLVFLYYHLYAFEILNNKTLITMWEIAYK